MPAKLPEFFEFSMPSRVIYGANIVDDLDEAIAGFGLRKAMLVTDGVIVDLGLADRLKASLAGKNVVIGEVFSDVPANSTIATVERCAERIRSSRCNMIIGLGGGSVMDTAKVANILAVKGGRAEDHMGAYLLGDAELLPLILIPTTAGTGSEVTKVAIIADPEKNIKLPFAETQFFPQLAILDPTLTTSMPPGLTAATGMDALTHAIEAYVSREAQPASDALALYVIRLVNDSLLDACREPANLEFRGRMLVASCLAGMAFTQSMVGMVHGISHALGGVYHIPHGLANALVLPEVMTYNMSTCSSRYADVAEAMRIELPKPVATARNLLNLAGLRKMGAIVDKGRFVDDIVRKAEAHAAVARIRELLGQLATVAALPLNLVNAGVDTDFAKFDLVVEAAMMDGSMLYNPKEVTADSVAAVLKTLHARKPSPVSYLPPVTASVAAADGKAPEKARVFTDSAMIYDVLGNFYKSLIENEELGPRLLNSNLVVQFRYSDPKAVITLDASGSEVVLFLGDVFDGVPEVTMSMKADFAHAFWQGKANFLTALTRRQVTSKGNVPKAVKLLPILKPAYELYPEHLKSHGHGHLILAPAG
ncbi:iron-containing alcohol dehydrogenase [Allohahella marinimesophila]|uniref:Alcohol dehydrogenase class IV n=1 Tax=Allohahella marinimesophila TaxID=1054972 RepID=A0ABP7PV40_9GAMM